jgi:hypothetical protein
MFQLEGRLLLATVTVITSIGFLMIGFDNGLMGGFGKNTRSFSILFDHTAFHDRRKALSVLTPSQSMALSLPTASGTRTRP